MTGAIAQNELPAKPRTHHPCRKPPRTATPSAAQSPRPHTHRAHSCAHTQGHAGWGTAPPNGAHREGASPEPPGRRRSGRNAVAGLERRLRAGPRPSGDPAAGVPPRPSPHGLGLRNAPPPALPQAATPAPPPPPPSAEQSAREGAGGQGQGWGRPPCLEGAAGTGWGRRTKERAPAPGPACRAGPAAPGRQGALRGAARGQCAPGPRAALT
jgi:hypothetical protein